MSLSLSSVPPALSREGRLVALLDRCLVELQNGRAVDRERVLAENPEFADELTEYLESLEFICAFRGADAQLTAEQIQSLKTLGDYQLIREVGRGGMGVVYEAEQISLSRRVALKVLPFAAVLDSRHLQRFKNEALAAAHLDHPNIVEVYGVGCERGVHFFAMRFVEGATLADVIGELQSKELQAKAEAARAGKATGAGNTRQRNKRSRELPANDLPTAAISNAPMSNGKGTSAADARGVTLDRAPANGPEEDSLTPSIRHAFTETSPIAALSTLYSTHPEDYFRRVAELGIQAAEALEHAHQMGIVHRDIKPSNLMLDERGKLWITDFGLASVESDASLTMTGDILGTLRYMSPEQAEGKSGVLDHRTDIYSLGVTLYELVTLSQAFPQRDRNGLLKQIVTEDLPAPRTHNQSIPLDLQTILLKAAARDSADRYPSANEFSADLRRFSERQPISARPPTAGQRLGKWCRHRMLLLVFTLVVLAVSAVSLAAVVVLVTRAYHERGIESDRATANLLQTHEVIDQLLTRVSENRLLSAPHMAPMRKALLLDALEANRALLRSNDDSVAARYQVARAQVRAANLLGEIGSANEAMAHAEAATELARTLMDEVAGHSVHQELLADGLRAKSVLHFAEHRPDQAQELEKEAIQLREALVESYPDSIRYRERLAQEYGNLAASMTIMDRPDEAIALYRKSLALRPNQAMVHVNLGNQLRMMKRHREAEQELRDAIRLGDPEDPHLVPWARYTLSGVLAEMKRRDESRVELRQALSEIDAAVRDQPRMTEWRRQQIYNLLTMIKETHGTDLPEAIHLCERAIESLEELLRQLPEDAMGSSMLDGSRRTLATLKSRLDSNSAQENSQPKGLQ